MFKIIFWMPRIVLSWISLLLPFNKKGYQPSGALDRELSQTLNNAQRRIVYYSKRIINPRY